MRGGAALLGFLAGTVVLVVAFVWWERVATGSRTSDDLTVQR